MPILIRQSWFRVLTVTISITLVAVFSQYMDPSLLRDSLTKAMQASTILFAVSAALSLALLNNYIKGLKEASLKKIADAKSIIEKIYDEFHDTDDKDLKEIVESYIAPLLSLSTSHWLSFEPLKPILDRIEAPITRVHERDHFIVPRYFLRLEDEINELGILYIRRIVSGLHTDIIKGAFLLLCVGSLSFLLVAIIPHTPTSNLISIAISVAIIVFAVLEMLLLVSYLMQEAFEELPDYEQADEEDPIT